MSFMNMEDEEELFEIKDFTVITELEAFSSSIEDVLLNLKKQLTAHKNSENDSKNKFHQDGELFAIYRENKFRIDYYNHTISSDRTISQQKYGLEEGNDLAYLCNGAKQLLISDDDFCEAFEITKQYGVFEYVVMTPQSSVFSVNEGNFYDIMSAVNPAVQSSDWHIPFFVPYGDPNRSLYFGVCLNMSARIVFEGAHLRSCLYKHRFLDAITDIFKEKVNAPFSISNADRRINMSIQLDYLTRKLSFDKVSDTSETESVKESSFCDHKFLIGADLDPFDQLNLFVSWLSVNENVVNENENYSDLDPMSAPRWYISVGFHGDSKYNLYSFYSDILELHDGIFGDYSIKYIASKRETEKSSKSHNKHPDPASALTRLTDDNASQFSIEAGSKLIGSALLSKKAKIETDFKCDFCINALVEDSTSEQPCSVDHDDLLNQCKIKLAASKSAPKGIARSISRCLSLKFAHENEQVALEEVAFLWNHFINFLRDHWENMQNIPSIPENATPDFSCCLLYQKLQMLQFCIKTRQNRNNQILEIETEEHEGSSINEDDEFFDANESFSSSSKPFERAVGVLQVLPLGPTTCLLNFTDTAISVPITQDRGPMTEDMLEKHTEYLASLGDGNERTRAQIDTLCSDMQAFKAANPGCVLEDFVRWHSPRDWIQFDENSSEGELSDRMRASRNIWRETWEEVKAVPVSHQPRLFNETKEANLIFEYFSNLKIRELIDLIIPLVTVDALENLMNRAFKCLSLVQNQLVDVCTITSKATHHIDFDDFYAIKNGIEYIECTLARYESLHELFSKQNLLDAVVESADGSSSPLIASDKLNEFIIELLQPLDSTSHFVVSSNKPWTTRKVRVLDAPLGPLATLVRNCMVENEEPSQEEQQRPSDRTMPSSYRKQYILRSLTPRSGPGSRLMPQRMYASVAKDEFRLCGSFSSDISYI